MFETIALVIMTLVAGGLCVAVVLLLLKKKVVAAPLTVRSHTVAERVRSVGKIVGLEVHAKEIATSTKGWSWMPPILLSQARIAMIFHFEKQYYVDLTRLRESDAELLDSGLDAGTDRPRYRLRLPPVEGSLRLTDVTPYDIQAGRVLGLIDVIQMDAQTQKELMRSAQEQASELFHKAESRYIQSAQRSIEGHLEALVRLFDVSIEVAWSEHSAVSGLGAGQMGLGDTLGGRLADLTRR